MPELVLDWKKYTEAAVQAAAEGIVMIKNSDNVLPLKADTKVALFGRMQNNYYKSGTGSGGMVNVQHVVSLREGLLDTNLKIDEELINIYDSWEIENPVDNGIGWGKEKWSQEEMPLEDETVKSFAQKNDVAVIVIARTAGEDRDNTFDKGSYRLSDGEENMLAVVTKYFKKTVVLLNVGNIIDTDFVSKYDISSVLYVWQSGIIGGTSCAKVVTGEINPSGCLTDTIAKTIEDYPSDKNFGKQDIYKDIYQEDIFVGYRYFSTFAPDRVLYPFGFGLSYTKFELSSDRLIKNGSTVEIDVTVKNTGDVAGKKSVLIFAEAPIGKIAKSKRVLAGFDKTDILNPGESQKLTIKIDEKYLASFDDDNKAGLSNGWILEAGDYKFYLGGDVDSAKFIGQVNYSESVNIEPLTQALAPVELFQRMTTKADADGNVTLVYEDVPVRKHENIEDRFKYIQPEIPQTGDKGIKLIDVKNGKASMDDFIAQLTDEDLCLIIRGEGMSSPKVTAGTAGAFAGVTKEHMALGIPTVCCSDGPSGMRIDSGKKAFALPNGTCLASSFNLKLIEELFIYFGIELVSNRIDTILGPGINIHRHPLNGRNFEYFSEDPLLTGRMAVAMLQGMQKNGVTGTIKHFTVNNRETKRRAMDSVVSERALREIYLRAYEIAIKEGGATTIMTVYNLINGTYGAANYELNTEILRNQWGYKGITMTDWWASAVRHEKEYDPTTEHSYLVRAQNDLFMVCSSVEKEFLNDADTYEELLKEDGRITRAELQRNARNILTFAMNSQAMNRLAGDEYTVKHENPIFTEGDIDLDTSIFYNVDEDPVIRVEDVVDTSVNSDFAFGVILEKPGMYKIEMVATSELNTLAQIPMTIFITSIPINVTTWNGTEGREATKTATTFITTKHSVFRAHFSGAGVKLKTMTFKYEGPIPEDWRKKL